MSKVAGSSKVDICGGFVSVHEEQASRMISELVNTEQLGRGLEGMNASDEDRDTC